jgi:hypothetical protein
MHMTLTALDPPLTPDRRWRCRDCGLSGTYDAVKSQPCPKAKVDALSPEKQLEAWAAGNSVCPSTTGECCPDFSCCRPKLAWSMTERARFIAADQGTREKMMLGGISALVAPGVKVHVTRGEPKDHE